MLPSSPEICVQHLEFMAWADALMTEAVTGTIPNAIGPLQHIYLAEMVWFDRVSGNEAAQIVDYQAPESVPDLAAAFREIHAKWLRWAAELVDFATPIPHRNLKGESFCMPAWQIVLHLVNHGSYHRGQVAALLRANGFAPPATDLILWYRARNS